MTHDDKEDTIDIYSDLPSFNYTETIKKLEQNNSDLKEKVIELKNMLDSALNEKAKFEEKCNNLSFNISSLLKTAQAEINRKNNTIVELREKFNNGVFRRNKKWPRRGSSDNEEENEILEMKRKRLNSDNRVRNEEGTSGYRMDKRDYVLHKRDKEEKRISRAEDRHRHHRSARDSRTRRREERRRSCREVNDEKREEKTGILKKEDAGTLRERVKEEVEQLDVSTGNLGGSEKDNVCNKENITDNVPPEENCIEDKNDCITPNSLRAQWQQVLPPVTEYSKRMLKKLQENSFSLNGMPTNGEILDCKINLQSVTMNEENVDKAKDTIIPVAGKSSEIIVTDNFVRKERSFNTVVIEEVKAVARNNLNDVHIKDSLKIQVNLEENVDKTDLGSERSITEASGKESFLLNSHSEIEIDINVPRTGEVVKIGALDLSKYMNKHTTDSLIIREKNIEKSANMCVSPLSETITKTENLSQNETDSPKESQSFSHTKSTIKKDNHIPIKKRSSKVIINPISKQWQTTESQTSEKANSLSSPVKKVASTVKLDIMETLFGSPLKWVDENYDLSELGFSDTNSTGTQMKVDKPVTVDTSNQESFIKQVSTSRCLPNKIGNCIIRESSNSCKDVIKVARTGGSVVKYDDSTLGQFEDTIQFISALSLTKPQVSPIGTPEKPSNESTASSQLPEKPFTTLRVNQETDFKIVGPNEKPINVLKPRKEPRLTNPSDKSELRSKGQSSFRNSVRISSLDNKAIASVCHLVSTMKDKDIKISPKKNRDSKVRKVDNSLCFKESKSPDEKQKSPFSHKTEVNSKNEIVSVDFIMKINDAKSTEKNKSPLKESNKNIEEKNKNVIETSEHVKGDTFIAVEGEVENEASNKYDNNKITIKIPDSQCIKKSMCQSNNSVTNSVQNNVSTAKNSDDYLLSQNTLKVMQEVKVRKTQLIESMPFITKVNNLTKTKVIMRKPRSNNTVSEVNVPHSHRESKCNNSHSKNEKFLLCNHSSDSRLHEETAELKSCAKSDVKSSRRTSSSELKSCKSSKVTSEIISSKSIKCKSKTETTTNLLSHNTLECKIFNSPITGIKTAKSDRSSKYEPQEKLCKSSERTCWKSTQGKSESGTSSERSPRSQSYRNTPCRRERKEGPASSECSSPWSKHKRLSVPKQSHSKFRDTPEKIRSRYLLSEKGDVKPWFRNPPPYYFKRRHFTYRDQFYDRRRCSKRADILSRRREQSVLRAEKIEQKIKDSSHYKKQIERDFLKKGEISMNKERFSNSYAVCKETVKWTLITVDGVPNRPERKYPLHREDLAFPLQSTYVPESVVTQPQLPHPQSPALTQSQLPPRPAFIRKRKPLNFTSSEVRTESIHSGKVYHSMDIIAKTISKEPSPSQSEFELSNSVIPQQSENIHIPMTKINKLLSPNLKQNEDSISTNTTISMLNSTAECKS